MQRCEVFPQLQKGAGSPVSHLSVGVAQLPELSLEGLKVLGDVSQRSGQGRQPDANRVSPFLDVLASLKTEACTNAKVEGALQVLPPGIGMA